MTLLFNSTCGYKIDFLFSQDCVLWVLLPFATDEMKSDAARLQGRFTGDPSFINEYKYTRKTGDGETMQEESVTVKREIQFILFYLFTYV